MQYQHSASSVYLFLVLSSEFNHASHCHTHKPISRYTLMLHGSALSDLANKQKSVAFTNIDVQHIEIATIFS